MKKYALGMTGGTTLLLIAALFASASPSPPGPSPRQVAETLDSIVQPRFQQNAGRFGVDRVLIQGHDNVYDIEDGSRSDHRKLSRVKSARRPFIIAFLHCVHKPGHDVGSKKTYPIDTPFKPYTEILASGTVTSSGTNKLYNWGEAHLLSVTAPALPKLRQGKKVDVETGNWLVTMRPVRANHDACLGCHEGAKRGDTLGVMVYAVDKNVNSSPSRNIQTGFR